MPKRRTQRQRRIGAEASRREAHARLVAQRSQDPEYVHREHSEDGYTVSMPPGSRAAAELTSAVKGQRERFREQFGREIEPEDPLFWDPDAEEPTPITEDQFAGALDGWAESVVEAGLDAAPVLAMRDLGYMVMEETEHLFSLAELDDFERAVAYYRSVDDPLTAPPYRRRPTGTTRDDSNGDTESGENFDEAVRSVVRVVGELIEVRKARAGFAINRRLEQQARTGVDSEPLLAAHLAAASALVASVERFAEQVGYDRARAVDWVRHNLGSIAANAAAQVANALVEIESGTERADAVGRLRADFGDNLLAALAWLLAGAVATAGDEDPTWLLRVNR